MSIQATIDFYQGGIVILSMQGTPVLDTKEVLDLIMAMQNANQWLGQQSALQAQSANSMQTATQSTAATNPASSSGHIPYNYAMRGVGGKP
jgi:hypothetical protein